MLKLWILSATMNEGSWNGVIRLVNCYPSSLLIGCQQSKSHLVKARREYCICINLGIKSQHCCWRVFLVPSPSPAPAQPSPAHSPARSQGCIISVSFLHAAWVQTVTVAGCRVQPSEGLCSNPVEKWYFATLNNLSWLLCWNIHSSCYLNHFNVLCF